MEAKLHTVHDAMMRAQDNSRRPLKSFSFKADEEIMQIASEICERHGVTLPSFLRECINSLIDDYIPSRGGELVTPEMKD